MTTANSPASRSIIGESMPPFLIPPLIETASPPSYPGSVTSSLWHKFAAVMVPAAFMSALVTTHPGAVTQMNEVGFERTASSAIVLASQHNAAPISVGSTRSLVPRTNDQLIRELHKRSGLTWDQVARLFGVSRRAVHAWASGSRLTSEHEERLIEAHSLVSAMAAQLGRADSVRANLLTPAVTGRSLLETFRQGNRIPNKVSGSVLSVDETLFAD